MDRLTEMFQWKQEEEKIPKRGMFGKKVKNQGGEAVGELSVNENGVLAGFLAATAAFTITAQQQLPL